MPSGSRARSKPMETYGVQKMNPTTMQSRTITLLAHRGDGTFLPTSTTQLQTSLSRRTRRRKRTRRIDGPGQRMHTRYRSRLRSVKSRRRSGRLLSEMGRLAHIPTTRRRSSRKIQRADFMRQGQTERKTRLHRKRMDRPRMIRSSPISSEYPSSGFRSPSSKTPTLAIGPLTTCYCSELSAFVYTYPPGAIIISFVLPLVSTTNSTPRVTLLRNAISFPAFPPPERL